MITLSSITYEALESEAHALGLALPVEQTGAWASFEAAIEGRTPRGAYRIEDDGKPVGFVSLIDYETHGYHYLRAHRGPVWVADPDEAEEARLLSGLASALSALDRKQVFARLSVMHDLDITRPTLSTLPYDTTVVIDVRGGEDEILSRMKPRGRRDVRKALRECPAELADETEAAAASFDEYYQIMVETGERDGFTPAPVSDYRNMVSLLGPDHCRVFAARIDGKLEAWSLVTLNDGRATRYYAATTATAGRARVADKLVFFECCQAGELGCTEYDLMGIGSAFAPETMNLNEFKTKFAKDGVVAVAPDRDLPLHRQMYGMLARVKASRVKRAERAEREAERAAAHRDDILPVVLGGDVSTYALCREFHEAYGCPCICVVPAPIALISHSSFITHRYIEESHADEIAEAVCAIAEENPGKRIVLMANTDALVEEVERAADRFPESVICPLPPHDLMKRVSDKVEFERLCGEYGLDAPTSEIVSLAGTAPIGPTKVPFPLIAKPAVSSEYSHLYVKGFKKIYFIHEQAELDELWRDLRAVGFAGEFLVQELIEGDDTYVDMITVYIDSRGKATMFASSQVLLEDHDPSLFGNPVAMITRPKPHLWEKVAAMLTDLGWRGFANFDLKRDPHTGREIFMDFNPRIGRNSYYAVAGGVNPMKVLVEDLVDDVHRGAAKVDRCALYTLCPPAMLRRYITDPELLAEFNEIVSAREVYNPTRYREDSVASRMDGMLMEKNYIRKFAKHYPEPTDTSF